MLAGLLRGLLVGSVVWLVPEWLVAAVVATWLIATIDS